MQFKDLTKEEIASIYMNIDLYLAQKEIKWTKYIDLGCKIVKLVSYSDEFLPLVEKQLTYVLKDKKDITYWKESE